MRKRPFFASKLKIFASVSHLLASKRNDRHTLHPTHISGAMFFMLWSCDSRVVKSRIYSGHATYSILYIYVQCIHNIPSSSYTTYMTSATYCSSPCNPHNIDCNTSNDRNTINGATPQRLHQRLHQLQHPSQALRNGCNSNGRDGDGFKLHCLPMPPATCPVSANT